MTGAMSVYNGRSGYDLRTVSGDLQDVADNEPAPQTTPHGSAHGFVVGHHPGHVTVHLDRPDFTLAEARRLSLELAANADLAEPGVEAA